MAVPTIERRFFTWLKDLDVSFQRDCIFSTKRRFPMETPQKVTPKIYSGTNEYQDRIVLLYLPWTRKIQPGSCSLCSATLEF